LELACFRFGSDWEGEALVDDDARFFTRPAQEYGDDDQLFRETLDFQWDVLKGRPRKPAPFLVCGAYASGARICDIA
jgi:hypothetical protein